MEDFLHFRVHTDELDIDELMTFLHTQSDVHFAVKEFGKSNREHIHACIVLKCAKQTFVDRMKKTFKVINGNKYYGLTKLKKDYDTNARYCYKGKANDYPDVIYSIHTVEVWKEYYKAYWEEHKILHPVNAQVTPFVKEPRVKCRTFMQKLRDKVFEEYPALPPAIWRYYGYKSDDLCPTDIDTFDKCIDYLAELLYQSLGEAVKNIDDFIFERLYRGLLAAIIVRCPDRKLLKDESTKLVGKFRNKL